MKQHKEDRLIAEAMWWNEPVKPYFEVNGYKYFPELDREHNPDTGKVENVKISHMVTTPEGKSMEVDFTPYNYMTKNDLVNWIKQGMPGRKGTSPLRSPDLEEDQIDIKADTEEDQEEETMLKGIKPKKELGKGGTPETAAMALRGIHKR